MLAASTVAASAAAEERTPEPAGKTRDAKPTQTTAVESKPIEAQERTADPAGQSRDAKTMSATAPTVDLKIEGVRNGLQIRVLPKEGPAPEAGTSCEKDCEVTLPAGSYTLVATQPESPPLNRDTAPSPKASESNGDRQRLGHALGIGGIVAAALGSYLTVGALVARDGTQTEVVSGLNGFFFAGLTCIAVGGGLMIGGFSLAASDRTPAMGVDRMPSVAPRRSLSDMGVSVSGRF
jgi:hypothetical protein